MWSEDGSPTHSGGGGGNSDWVETTDDENFRPESGSEQTDDGWVGKTESENDESDSDNEYEDLTEDTDALDSMPDGDDGSSFDGVDNNDWG